MRRKISGYEQQAGPHPIVHDGHEVVVGLNALQNTGHDLHVAAVFCMMADGVAGHKPSRDTRRTARSTRDQARSRPGAFEPAQWRHHSGDDGSDRLAATQRAGVPRRYPQEEARLHAHLIEERG